LALSGSEAHSGEGELLQGLQEGSLPAFERLFTEHGEKMKSIAANVLGSRSDAEDAVQEAMLKAYRGAARFRGGASISTWLYRILLNTCYDFLRQSRRRAQAEAPMPPAEFAAPAAKANSPDHPLRLSIENALAQLDPRERTAFLLCEVEGFSHREAGEILEVGEGASRALLFRARRHLQKALDSSGAFSPAGTS
jgi:RNA polymerase sigma-70 factor, ECF subfamily